MGERGELRETYRAWAEQALERWLPREAPHFAQTLAWVHGRFAEGEAVGASLVVRLGGARPHRKPWRVLDLGSGNGGISLGVVQSPDLHAVACDVTLNGEVPELLSRTGRPFHYAVGNAERLPFASGSFDAVLMLDVIEHLPRPRAAGAEVARVLAPGGVVVVTTPPRAQFLFTGDPHLGIWGLALLPASLQRVIAERLLRRTKSYDVHHLYFTAAGVARQFPSLAIAEIGGRARRGLSWDRIVLQKLDGGGVRATSTAASALR